MKMSLRYQIMLNRNNTKSGISREDGGLKSYFTLGLMCGLKYSYSDYGFDSILNNKVLIEKRVANDVFNEINFSVRLNISGSKLLETASLLCIMMSENAK